MSMLVTFPGGSAVTAHYQGFDIQTDQPASDGVDNRAPTPYDLFIASLGTCAGFYALRFCQQRQLPTTGLQLTVDIDRDPVSKRLERVTIILHLPDGFPEKYRGAIVRAVDQCSVKRALLDPPVIAVTTAVALT